MQSVEWKYLDILVGLQPKLLATRMSTRLLKHSMLKFSNISITRSSRSGHYIGICSIFVGWLLCLMAEVIPVFTKCRSL